MATESVALILPLRAFRRLFVRRQWVDHIRTKGNEANHEIVILGQQYAEDLLSFLGMLLRIIYEFPAIIRRRSEPKPVGPAEV